MLHFGLLVKKMLPFSLDIAIRYGGLHFVNSDGLGNFVQAD
jgi:hypothetical protein